MKTKHPNSLISILVNLLIASLAFTSVASAEKRESMKNRLEKEKTIRLQKLMRSDRAEFTLSLGSSLGDAYKRSYPIGIGGAYHLSDQFALAASAFYALSGETSLAEEVRRVRPSRVSGDETFSAIDYGAGAELVYTPIHGKFSLLGISALRYDLSTTGGVYALGVSGAASDGLKIAPSLGLNGHFFIDERLAVTVFYKGFIYWRADHAVKIDGALKADDIGSVHSFGGLAVSFFTGAAVVETE